jgi:hypothetical protein
MPTNTALIKNNSSKQYVHVPFRHDLSQAKKPHGHAHPLGPLDFFAPSLRVNFFLGGARPSPPGVVAVGEGAALDAALLLIL